ncbi:MAG: NUDIX domain-containing protein [Erysipelotrichaceae bacterium]|nr:NUDIX domain-containing protein [Erysipelotrichaceae bacterium]MDY5251744.1 NUDIX domain-containing protein [Erysipelotrichaceae bacterium]
MNRELSCGAIVIHGDDILLIKSIYGHWGFPKGHQENGENDQQTAIREVKEETNIDINILADTYFSNEYSPKKDVIKEVRYFIATCLNDVIKHQESELTNAKWVNIADVLDYLTFDNDKDIFIKAMLALGKAK